ncbi:protein AMBP-like isoform X2 [Stegostoma tigrinum]|uniref:protein AMBP-like isoform X2 n=1 Tax=Stegostoma tigrinum TaxID=3053191 RepID=UPI00202B1B39|nr:protein AMBP-like isoform X2 [Stegostoma tigrinum]
MIRFRKTLISIRNGTCDHLVGDYEIQDIPGHFVFNSTSAYASRTDIQVIKMNYQEYAFLLLNTMKAATSSESVALYGRTRKLRKEIKDEFKDFALRHGIPGEMVLFLPEKGACLPWDPIPESPVKKHRKWQTFREQRSVLTDFVSKIDTAESCQMEPDSGPCFGRFRRFYYNQNLMACQIFVYGGCAGNRNNFETEQSCLQSCRTVDE